MVLVSSSILNVYTFFGNWIFFKNPYSMDYEKKKTKSILKLIIYETIYIYINFFSFKIHVWFDENLQYMTSNRSFYKFNLINYLHFSYIHMKIEVANATQPDVWPFNSILN